MIYLLCGFALATTLSQTLMDVFETLLWLATIHQVLFVQQNPYKRLKRILIIALAFIAIQTLGIMHSDFSAIEILKAILEWRWVFTGIIIGYYTYHLSPRKLQLMRMILIGGLLLIVITSIIKYYTVEWMVQRANGWIGYMPLAHNLLLWFGWVVFSLNLKQGSYLLYSRSCCDKHITSSTINALGLPQLISSYLKKHWLHLMALMSMWWLLVLTETRGAWIGFTVFFLALGWNFAKKYRWITLAAIMLTVFFSSQLPIIKNRINQTDLYKDASTRTRIYFWEGYWELFKQDPLFGAGYPLHKYLYFDKLSTEKQDYIIKADPGLRTAHAHNQPLYILSGVGLIGFILYYSLILSPFVLYHLPEKWLIKLGLPPENREPYKKLAPPLLAAILGFHAASLTEASLSIAKNRSLYIFLLATLWSLYLRPHHWLGQNSSVSNGESSST